MLCICDVLFHCIEPYSIILEKGEKDKKSDFSFAFFLTIIEKIIDFCGENHMTVDVNKIVIVLFFEEGYYGKNSYPYAWSSW